VNKTKYVVIDFNCGWGTTMEQMFIFSDLIKHNDFVYALEGTPEVVSAGFISLRKDIDGNMKVSAHGKSMSLGVESREQDTKIAAHLLGLSKRG
jgi:hypothetical protein